MKEGIKLDENAFEMGMKELDHDQLKKKEEEED